VWPVEARLLQFGLAIAKNTLLLMKHAESQDD